MRNKICYELDLTRLSVNELRDTTHNTQYAAPIVLNILNLKCGNVIGMTEIFQELRSCKIHESFS